VTFSYNLQLSLLSTKEGRDPAIYKLRTSSCTGLVRLFDLTKLSFRQILHKTRPAVIEVCLVDKWMKGKSNESKDGRTDGWMNGNVQADREIDIMKLTFIFLYIANASKVGKNSASQYST